MELSKLEQETIVLFNEAEATASVYTHNKKLREKLERMALKFPGKVALERPEQAGAVSYLVPKSCVSIREPYSDERRAADRERALNAGARPPTRGISPTTE
jgi:hypothetical protein